MSDLKEKKIAIPERNQGESLSDYSYRILKTNIMQFNLVPGDIINEDEIAKMLGISRTPVHESVLNLCAEKLISIKPRKESRVTMISVSAINEGIFVRSCIEPEIILQSRGNLASHYIKLLMDNLEQQKKLINGNIDTRMFFNLDDEFHKLLYDGTNKSQTYEMMKRISVQFDRVRYLILLSDINTGRNPLIYNEHQELFNIVAFKSNLDIEIKSFILGHITCLEKYFSKLFSLYPNYFSFD